MSPRPDGRLGPAFVPIGAVALVAGCSGGGVNSNGAFVPAGSNRAMTTAQITLTFGTGASSAGRKAMALDSTVQQVGIRFIPVPAPSVTPTEQMFTIPQPVPASTTLMVQAPVGQDQFFLGAYEPTPSCILSNKRVPQARSTPTLVPLNGAVQTVNLNANGTNPISAPVQPLAFGAFIGTNSGVGYLVGQSWGPLENLSVAQSVGMTVTPIDPCGNTLSGTAPNALTVSGPANVSFSTTTFNAAGTITATYAANTNAGGTITVSPSLPVTTANGGFTGSTAVLPDYFIFALDTSGSYLAVASAQGDPFLSLPSSGVTLGKGRVALSTRRTQSIGAGNVNGIAAVNASPCTGGSIAAAVAVVGTLFDGHIDVFTVTPSGVVSGPTVVPWSTIGGFTVANPTAVAFDAACRLYVGDVNGYLGVGSISGMTSVANINGFNSNNPITGIVAGPSAMYVAYQFGSNWNVATFPLGSTTISATTFPTLTNAFPITNLALAGGNVYVGLHQNNTGPCYVDFRSLNGSSLGGTFTVGGSGVVPQQLVGAATSSALYSAISSGYLLSISSGGITSTTTAPDGRSILGVALSQDSPTSTLWLSSASGTLYQYALPALTASSITRSVTFPAGGASPGPLVIAP